MACVNLIPTGLFFLFSKTGVGGQRNPSHFLLCSFKNIKAVERNIKLGEVIARSSCLSSSKWHDIMTSYDAKFPCHSQWPPYWILSYLLNTLIKI